MKKPIRRVMSVHGYSSTLRERVLFLDLHEWGGIRFPKHASVINHNGLWVLRVRDGLWGSWAPRRFLKDVMYASTFIAVRNKVGGFKR